MYPSEWTGRKIEVLAHHYPAVWVEDPYNLVGREEIQTLQSRLALAGHTVVSVEDAFHLRMELNPRDPSAGRLVLIDKSYTLRDPHLLPKDAKPSDLVPLAAPDWKPFIPKEAFFRPTIRDFLIDVTEDPCWPSEVNIFPYEALAQTDPEGFVRAFQSFRQSGRVLTSDDLVLVGASAVMKSPGVVAQLRSIEKPPKDLTEILGAKATVDVSEMLLTTPSARRQELAKLFKAVLGKKCAKTVLLKAFSPKTDVIWDRNELGRLVKEFEGFVTEQWEEGKYLKIE